MIVYYSGLEFYQSYMMIETKIIIHSDTSATIIKAGRAKRLKTLWENFDTNRL
jgi:hypothetical protein